MPRCPLLLVGLPAADSGGGGALSGGHGGGGHGQRTFSASDMGGVLDDAGTSSSVSALHDELAEKNKLIERLQVGWVGWGSAGDAAALHSVPGARVLSLQPCFL